MHSKRVVVPSLLVSVVVACATAEDQPSDSNSAGVGGKSGAAQGGAAGKPASAGTTSVSKGGNSTAVSEGGKSSAGNGGVNSGGSGGGGSSAGTNARGTGSTGLACSAQAAAGSGGDAGVAGAGGAASVGAAFFDDFESAVASKWTTTLGTWAIVDDGSKVYEQSVQENKLQVAIANDGCFADQIIDAKVKIVGFKGQSNSYAAAVFGRMLSPTTHYLLALGSDGKLALRKRVNSSSTGATAIGTAITTPIVAGGWYDVHFEIIGKSLKGCIGAVCVTGTDSSIESGSVGVGTVNTSARFDDVVVVTVP